MKGCFCRGKTAGQFQMEKYKESALILYVIQLLLTKEQPLIFKVNLIVQSQEFNGGEILSISNEKTGIL